ncbi:MAG: DEAD/DEAH box helicase, partial [Candidatus Omnitrophica bacterium]|nr:DEAD/DEAH box helicase [Candidatus Omnitrophota bacterium]
MAAPTGAGKTLIAEFAIEKAMARSENVVYTAPIKALSNQKFRDFRARYGADQVGILTGDVSINPDAPILIMTTEIYRNWLFETSERVQKIGWVIYDEIHYLDDPERGTVWEESILLTPPNVHILALSATVPNVQQLAEWIRSVHERPIAVVEENHRPVPLHFLFQCQGRILENMRALKRDGYLNRENWRMSNRERRQGFQPMRARPNRLDHLLQHLIEEKKLPAIYFAFGRRRTEDLAWEATSFDFLDPEERNALHLLYDELLKRYDLHAEKSAEDMRTLVDRGIAYHHAGMLPTLKEVIEQLFTSRLIKVIFTTETFALGINMPARTVIFDELEKFYGTGFKHLTTRDFYQMAGRAGRRGMDQEGFVYARIHPNDIAYGEVERILYGRPEAIESQLNTAYATVLNLYRNLGENLLTIYPKTFHFFQSHKKRRADGYDLLRRKLEMLKELSHIRDGRLTLKGEFASSLFGYELPLAEMFEEKVLDELNEVQLNMILSGLVFEPRKGDHLPRLGPAQEKLARLAEHYSRHIYRKELKFRVYPYCKLPHFHMARAV